MKKQSKSRYSPNKQFVLDKEKIHAKYDYELANKKYHLALKENECLKKELQRLSNIPNRVTTYTIKPSSSRKHEAVAVAVASDWHVEERVDKASVDGVNEYSLEIAKARSGEFFSNIVKLVCKEQQDAQINTLVLALLGDFISSDIHEELISSAQLPPVEAMLYAQDLLASGIQYILDKTNLNLIIPCCSGNHERKGSKVNIAHEYGTSLATIAYRNMANHFKDEKRVKFIIPRSYFCYVEILGYTVRFHHGHAVRYGGGVGGLTIPMIKAISRWDMSRKADYTVCGHFHQRLDGGHFLVNGSLIGDTPYSRRLGFSNKPEQLFFLINKGRGKTGVFPIFLER